MSLRWRLTLYYTLISAVLLGLGTLILYGVLSFSLRKTLDDSLREAAVIAASQLGAEDVLAQEINDIFVSRLPGATVIQIYDKTGRLIDRFGTPAVKAPLQMGFLSVGDTRIYAEPLPQGGTVQVMRSQAETNRTIGQSLRLLLVSLPLLWLVCLGGGYVLADRALRPVDSVTRLAQRIAELGRYQERLPESPGTDEMARLTQTFNAMLSRLETTIEREKAFALAAAHELRTPLSVLQGRASLSLEKERSPQQYQEALRVVDRTSRELVGVVESLLMLARSNQTPSLQDLHLDFLALEACEGLSHVAKERKVKVHLELGSSPAQGDPLALRSALSNLIRNALQHGQEGGQVWVRSLHTARHALVEIADDGPGIAEGELERLRQPFQSGPLKTVGGAGLGLTLASAIAQQHGGCLVLGKAAQGGLLARLELPLASVQTLTTNRQMIR